MKNFLKVTLASLVAIALFAACAQEQPEETKAELQSKLEI